MADYYFNVLITKLPKLSHIISYGCPFPHAIHTDITLDKQYNHANNYMNQWVATMAGHFMRDSCCQ